MKKLLVIARKEVFLRFTDPAVWLVTIVAPLVIAALIDLAFGDLVLSRGIPDTSLPVGIVNRDRGGPWGNFGQIIVHSLSSVSSDTALPGDPPFRLLNVRQLEDEARARRMVRQGRLMAALLIPPNFSNELAGGGAALEVYINDVYDLRGTAVTSVVGTLLNRMATAQAAVRTTVESLFRYPRARARLRSGELNEAIARLALTAASPESNPIKIERIDHHEPVPPVRIGHYLAAAIAISFVGFTALMGSASLLQEKAQGTLQRMYVTPTRPGIIWGGKTLGTYLNGLIQMGVLVGGLASIQWLMHGRAVRSPSVDLPGLTLLILAVVAAATGLTMVIAGLAPTVAQAANYGRAIILLTGLIGGIFIPVALLPRPFDVLSWLTFQYWAMDGYLKLAAGGSVFAVLPHLLILWAMGLSFFGVGSWLLRRRIGLH